MVQITILFLITIAYGFSAKVSGPRPAVEGSLCATAERALRDAGDLKTGMTRKEIEAHNFAVAGGMVFRDHTAYIYKNCEYIRLEIDFAPDPTVERDFSPRDVISHISKLTLDYPPND